MCIVCGFLYTSRREEVILLHMICRPLATRRFRLARDASFGGLFCAWCVCVCVCVCVLCEFVAFRGVVLVLYVVCVNHLLVVYCCWETFH